MENDYKRNYFWIKRDLKGNKHYYFKIKGQYHEVSEEVYKICYNSFKKEEREKINDFNRKYTKKLKMRYIMRRNINGAFGKRKK